MEVVEVEDLEPPPCWRSSGGEGREAVGGLGGEGREVAGRRGAKPLLEAPTDGVAVWHPHEKHGGRASVRAGTITARVFHIWTFVRVLERCCVEIIDCERPRSR